MNGLEIERKFLIKMPNLEALSALEGVSVIEIEQTYTLVGARLRRWTENGKTVLVIDRILP